MWPLVLRLQFQEYKVTLKYWQLFSCLQSKGSPSLTVTALFSSLSINFKNITEKFYFLNCKHWAPLVSNGTYWFGRLVWPSLLLVSSSVIDIIYCLQWLLSAYHWKLSTTTLCNKFYSFTYFHYFVNFFFSRIDSVCSKIININK